MKTTLRRLVIIILVLTPTTSHTADGSSQKHGVDVFKIPPQIMLRIELQTTSSLAAPGSAWEVSYMLRVADQSDYVRWQAEGGANSNHLAPGILLSEHAYPSRELSTVANRLIEDKIAVNDELQKRFLHSKEQPQMVWLSASILVHDAKLGTDIINKVNPAWDLRYFLKAAGSVKMAMAPDGQLRWFITDTPPWLKGQTTIKTTPKQSH